MHIRPLHDKVLIKRLEEERKTPGGIVIPDSANKEKPSRGKVLAIGKGQILENGQVRPLEVKVGDIVLIGKYSGTEVKVDGEEMVVMREAEIMAILE
jgi:chaperonin GroES